MRLILVRHGASWHGRNRIVGGPIGCTGLTPQGRTQAERLRDRLARPGVVPEPARLLSSPWPRAMETASIIQPAFANATVCPDDRLRELDPGVADGLSWDAYVTRYGEFDLLAEPDRPFAPGGESHNMYQTRVTQFLDVLAMGREGSETVVAVTHGGFVFVSLLALLDIPRPGTGTLLHTSNTGLTVFDHADGWTLERYNDTAHLE